MAKSTKATKAQLEQRVSEVYSLILVGASREEICKYVRNKWGVVFNTADRYISLARQRMRSELMDYRAEALAENMALYRKLRREAYQDGDKRLVLDLSREQSKLLALYDSELLDRIEALEKHLEDANK